MITREDIRQAIAECQVVRNPNANTCIKLAAYLTIQQHLFGESEFPASYSEAPEVQPSAVSAFSESDFSAAIAGKPLPDVMPILDELMQAVSVLNPRLYAAAMRKLSEI